jgi:predicted amidohydrolase YtcJ
MVGLQARYANLLPAPDGEGDAIASLQRITRDWMGQHAALVRKSKLVIGFGYDDSQLKERRHPTRTELDAISDEVPILFLHQSGHIGVVNTPGLVAARVTAATPDPSGGVYRRETGSREPNGVLEETALFAVMGALFTRMDAAANREMLREGAAF